MIAVDLCMMRDTKLVSLYYLVFWLVVLIILKDKDKEKKKYEPPPPPTRTGAKRKKRRGAEAATKLPAGMSFITLINYCC